MIVLCDVVSKSLLFTARCKGANREGCCLQREYPLISREIIWWFVFCSALPRLLVPGLGRGFGWLRVWNATGEGELLVTQELALK